MQGCWSPTRTVSLFYLLSHVSNSNHLPPQTAVTFYKTFLQIHLNPKEAIYIWSCCSLALCQPVWPPPLFSACFMFSSFLWLRSVSVDWRRANQFYCLLPPHPPSSFPIRPSKVFQRKQNLMEFMTWLLPGHTAGYSPHPRSPSQSPSSGCWYGGEAHKFTCHLTLATLHDCSHHGEE